MPSLRFRVAGFPVRIDASFLLIALLLSAGTNRPAAYIALWMGVVFVAILAHELGHAFAFQAYGVKSSITLFAMGGVTTGEGGGLLSPARTLAVSVAGPFTGIALGLPFALWHPDPSAPLWLHVLDHDMAFASLGWGILNLLPVLPLDGGQSFRSIVDLATDGRGELPAIVVSILVAGAGAIWAFANDIVFTGVLASLLAFTNVAALSARRKAPQLASRAEQAEAAAWQALDAGRIDEAEQILSAFPYERPLLAAGIDLARGRTTHAIERIAGAARTPGGQSGADLRVLASLLDAADGFGPLDDRLAHIEHPGQHASATAFVERLRGCLAGGT